MKKIIAFLLIVAVILTNAACSSNVPQPEAAEPPTAQTIATEPPVTEPPVTEPPATEPEDLRDKIGIAMPNRNQSQWVEEASDMKAMLEEWGYAVDLRYADNDAALQNSQVEEMIAEGCKVLVVTSVSVDGLQNAVAHAKEAGIPILSYEAYTRGADYHIRFDEYMLGEAQGQYVRDLLNPNRDSRTFYIEAPEGDLAGDRYNMDYYRGYSGVMWGCKESGVVQSLAEDGMRWKSACAEWTAEQAQEAFEEVLREHYADGTPLDAVVCLHSEIAKGVVKALESSYTNTAYPIVTGNGCDIETIRNILDGKQAMTLFKDPHELPRRTVFMVDALAQGNEPYTNDEVFYYRVVTEIPTQFVGAVLVTAENAREVLVDSGYYTAEELGL